MKHRFLVGWDEPTPDKHEVKTVSRKSRLTGKTIREEAHYNASRYRQEVFDGECLPREEIVRVEQSSTYEEACELLDLPLELWEEGHLAEAVKNRSPYVHRLRLIYPGRTLAFYWWTPYKAESSPLPDCFSVNPPDIGAHFPPWIEGSCRARGMLYLDGGNEKHSVFAIARENTVEEAAELDKLPRQPNVEGTDETPTVRQHACLTVLGDWENVLCRSKHYPLTTAGQAREMLRFLCESEAFSEDAAQHKSAIQTRLEERDLMTPGIDWRPHSPFTRKLRQLKADAIGCDETTGRYWIKP